MKKNKRKTPKKTNKKLSNIKLVNIVLALTVLTLSITIFAYYVILKNNSNKSSSIINEVIVNEISKEELLLDKYRQQRKKKYFDRYLRQDQYEEYTQELSKEYIPNEDSIKIIPPFLFKKEKTISKKSLIKNNINDKKNNNNININKEIKKEKELINNKFTKNTKANLFIIIDDITRQSQIDKINNIGYDITMSFMPPTPRHKNSAIIAQNIDSAMIHLPLEAQSFKFEEENTLHIGDSYEKIEKRIKLLRSLYPNVLYTNNHTGSKFTSNKVSMNRLLKALKKYDFIFVDSRTTAQSVVKEYTKKHNMPYIVRNIFLDNEKNFTYIQNQLKKAIKIAKKRGYAIAIGHPYSITMEVLNKSKNLFKDVNLLHINNIKITK